jgi:hypothetical protein
MVKKTVKKTKDKTQIHEEFYDFVERVNSLRDIVDERDRRYEQRFQSQEKAVQVALSTQEKHEERQNGLADKLSAQHQYFIEHVLTKQEYEGRHQELVDQIAALREFKAAISGDNKFDEIHREIETLREAKSKIEGTSFGIKQSWGVVAAINIAILGFIGVAITLVEVFILGK